MKEKDKRKAKIKKIHSYTKYSGIVYQIFGLLAVTIFLGLKADAYFGNENKFITAGASLFILLTYLYKISITVMKK